MINLGKKSRAALLVLMAVSQQVSAQAVMNSRELILACTGTMRGIATNPHLKFDEGDLSIWTNGAWGSLAYLKPVYFEKSIVIDQKSTPGGTEELIRTEINRESGAFTNVTVWNEDGKYIKAFENSGSCIKSSAESLPKINNALKF